MKATALIFARGDSKGLPGKNMVKTHADGTVGLVIPPQSAIVRRRYAPTVFDMAPSPMAPGRGWHAPQRHF